MEKITALVLSLILMFSAASYSEVTTATAVEVPAPNSTMAVSADTVIRSIPSRLGTVLAIPDTDSEVTIVRTASVLGVQWVCVSCGDVTGWVPAAQLEAPAKEKPKEEPIPSWARWGIVNTNQLNIRQGVGVNTEKVGVYNYGDRVAILETSAGWGRTPKGWVYLSYLYMDGDVGTNTMDGIVTAENLNIRKGPGTGYDIVGHLKKGEKVHVLEQFRFNGETWGCTKYGWICMTYVTAEVPEPTFVGYGVVIVDEADILSPTEPHPVIGTLKKGDIVPVLKLAENQGISWALTQKGWIKADCIQIIQEPEIPTEPETPTTPIEPEPPTEPEPTPTEPEAPTGPETTPTEPETTPTEPVTTPSEPEAPLTPEEIPEPEVTA